MVSIKTNFYSKVPQNYKIPLQDLKTLLLSHKLQYAHIAEVAEMLDRLLSWETVWCDVGGLGDGKKIVTPMERELILSLFDQVDNLMVGCTNRSNSMASYVREEPTYLSRGASSNALSALNEARQRNGLVLDEAYVSLNRAQKALSEIKKLILALQKSSEETVDVDDTVFTIRGPKYRALEALRCILQL